jgi:hypothetical protein
MHGVMGVMAALVVSAAGSESEATESDTGSEVEGSRTFVGLVVPLSAGGLAVEAERELDERFSVNLGLRVGFNLGEFEGFYGDARMDFLQLGIEPGVRFYLTGSVLDGMWFGPRLELAHTWQGSTSEGTPAQSVSSQREWGLGGALLTGYSILLGQGFSVQAALGVGLTHRRGTHTGTVMSPEGEPQSQSTPFRSWNVGHRAQLAVGWAF